jgi:hypothetical protein
LNEFLGARNGTVYVAFGGKMNNDRDVILAQNLLDVFVIANITPFKKISLASVLFCDVRKVQEIAGIGELVIVDDPTGEVCFPKDIPDEARADKPCPSGHKDVRRGRK